MNGVHILAAILAACRLTEVITTDRITERFRKRFKWYFWMCQRCVSIWVGCLVTILYFYYPYLNWPFAMSWLLIVDTQIRATVQSRTGRRIIIRLDENNHINLHSDGIANDDIPQILNQILNSQKTNAFKVRQQ